MTTPPNTDVQATEQPEQPAEQQTALDILTEMAEKYRQAKAYFDDVREGLVEAARDARMHGVEPVVIKQITGWSRTTVHANTQLPAASGRPTPTVQAPDSAVRTVDTTSGSPNTTVPAAEHAQT